MKLLDYHIFVAVGFGILSDTMPRSTEIRQAANRLIAGHQVELPPYCFVKDRVSFVLQALKLPLDRRLVIKQKLFPEST